MTSGLSKPQSLYKVGIIIVPMLYTCSEDCLKKFRIALCIQKVLNKDVIQPEQLSVLFIDNLQASEQKMALIF